MVGMEGRMKDLKSLNMDELAGLISLCPWFGAARVELCERMASIGGSDWGVAQYSDAAMYIPCRGKVFSIMRSAVKSDYSDRDLQRLLKEYISPSQPVEPVNTQPVILPRETAPVTAAAAPTMAGDMKMPVLPPVPGYHRTVRPAGGDFFSKEDYDNVKREEDNVFSRFKAERSEENTTRSWEDPVLGFCTETLAQIYAEQGYFAEAKKIYSHLILRYPEKSAYFASLIEQLQQEN
jgi:hypothetical protein